ncbi:type II toxin-antitoxin system RelE/ParE family toxin [Peteryoungia desertarenae]|uniref:Type II toxin-antitoxin system RelE/ParE family toxin n=1 Tax=Peteryoungia desertarenae TaxID=1813451 RepID=A0ABX6QM74_9HYPH|nr:type II toxin-antitoxin system RelE/ParE family toxin [Peteryoungia desertarenae]QLF69664.1 type II toxin-antitoxin system RelE/ParE family toxin [Peteryoungia desertarenae]
MAGRYVLSRAADRDILTLLQSSIDMFGEAQTDVYLAGIRDIFEMLATHPDSGATFRHPRSHRTYRRFNHGSHVIYHRQCLVDILIVRVPHVRMLPEKHL